MILLLDNHDSFTYNLAEYFYRLGAPVQVYRPHEMTPERWQFPWLGVVLSPGPGLPTDLFQAEVMTGAPANLVEAVDYFVRRGIPLLGICLGHQAIGVWAGATLAPCHQPVHGKIYELHPTGQGLYSGLPTAFQVVRYHSWLIEQLPPDLLADATTQSLGADAAEEIMAIRHSRYPVWGIQYHPEAALTAYGHHVLYRWLQQVQSHHAGHREVTFTLPAEEELPVYMAQMRIPMLSA